jgi:hypothetical protein
VGILERLTRSPSPRERFAEQVLAELRRVGIRHADYRPRQFAIVCDAGQDMFSWLFLARPFVEYEQNPADRKRLVREFVASSLAPATAPPTFELARPNLAVALRSVTLGSGVHARPSRSWLGALNWGPEGTLLRRPALPYLDEVVLVEHPRAYLDDNYPARWGVSAEEIFAAARANMALAAGDLDGASSLGRSVLHVPDYGGGTLISRIMLDGWLADFADRVGGRPVAFIPSNLMLLVCADEPKLLAHLFQVAGEEYTRTARPMSPMAYTPDVRGRISVYDPPRDHPAYHAAGKARRRLLTDAAERQRRALRDHRLAECTLATRLDGSSFTAATWELGSETLLPKVDFAGLAEPGERPFFVPWAVLAEADLLVEEIDFRPARYSTPARPSSAALGYLRERAVSL